MNNNKLPYIMLWILGIAVVLFLWTISAMITQNFNANKSEDYKTSPIPEHIEQPRETYTEKLPDTTTSEEIKQIINPLEEYNYMSKADIYRIRKKYVQTSLFASEDYEPSEEVFGQIEDGKLWWGLRQITCSQGSDNASGLSAMSRFINNPNLLMATFFPRSYTLNSETKDYCNSEFAKSIPYEITYNKKLNLITAKYKLGRIAVDNKHCMILIGINARDFGYNYVFINKLSNISMSESYNASNEIYQLRDFVHTGGSCQMKGGCNNISPRQTELEYYVTDFPAEINIKLWKNRPISKFSGADINYKIIFEEN